MRKSAFKVDDARLSEGRGLWVGLTLFAELLVASGFGPVGKPFGLVLGEVGLLGEVRLGEQDGFFEVPVFLIGA